MFIKMYDFSLIINKETKGVSYFFQYGNTKNIELIFSLNSACIKKTFAKDYSHNLEADSYFRNLFKEGMKRISLLHILYYQKQIKVKSVQLVVIRPGGEKEIYDLTNSFVVYSLIKSNLSRPIKQDWRNHHVLQNILRFQKSKPELARKTASLYAYLYSKTKTNETERFSFLWMAMNGMYGSMKPETSRDREQMANLIKEYYLGTEVLSVNTRHHICHLVDVKLNEINGVITKESLREEHKELGDYILQHIPINNETKCPFDLSAYGFLLTDFSYYLRCKLFHANRPVELFSFADDLEIKVLQIVNGLLEEFLDNNLINLFISDN